MAVPCLEAAHLPQRTAHLYSRISIMRPLEAVRKLGKQIPSAGSIRHFGFRLIVFVIFQLYLELRPVREWRAGFMSSNEVDFIK
ncbi:hypothetical protein ACIF8T_24425 [Streptomyces sp. NPDC085946]|uniref:hypothetical protein n=1 Tax=Streptomyces sp. NPDC085946 TaxID=3365744 RepID=UPI0037D5E74D